ncbi:MAG: hypothetical protein ABFS32_16340, partial [Bacteroidota bacterium]
MEDYKNAWKAFEKSPGGDYSTVQIEAIITGQTQQTSNSLQQYLKFDLVIKIISLSVLILIVYLFRNTPHLLPLSFSAIVGVLAAWRQGLLIKQSKLMIDFTLPVKDVVTYALQDIKSRLNLSSLLVGLTNPLFILAGSFVYFYNKYGTSYRQDTEDTIVTMTIMAIGFILGYTAFKLQQQSQLNDLETSLEIINNESDESIQLIAKRRRR